MSILALPEWEIVALLDLLAWTDLTVADSPYRTWHLWESPASLTSDIRLDEAHAELADCHYPGYPSGETP